MNKFIKWGLIAIGSLIILSVLSSIGNSGTSKSKSNIETEVSETEDIEVIKSTETVNDNMRIIHVEIKNNTDKLLTTGLVKIIYEDANSNLVGTGNGSILNLAAGASKVIDCMAMDVDGASSYKVEVSPLSYE